jgi:hypothetical protein
MASVSFEKNKRRSGTVNLKSNADSRLIIPFSRTLPVMQQILPADEIFAARQAARRKTRADYRYLDRWVNGRMSGFLVGWAVSQWDTGRKHRLQG